MSCIFSSKRLKCPNYFGSHKKAVYNTKRMNFLHIRDIAENLQFKILKISREDFVCSNCYKKIREFHNYVESNWESNSECEYSEKQDQDFQLTVSESIHELNSQVLINLTVSPLKQKGQISSESVKNYISRKSSEINDAAKTKLQKIYHVDNNNNS